MNFHKGQHIIADEFMEYGYSRVDDNSKVRMIMNGINTNSLIAYKADILYSPEMQGGFEISSRHFIDFIAMTPFRQNNATAKVSYATRSGGERGGGRGSDRGLDMTVESDVQASMGSIKNK